MVFPSFPVYLDPPNWPEQQQEQASGVGNDNLPPQQLPPPPLQALGGGGTGRPGSMSERARLANIAQPEVGLKCPRCESTNTKFCYFNNYSLSQPRHFCKTCRRYWTRGGALRNVPVGGGYRRNKRNKSSTRSKNRSKSPAPITADEPLGQAAASCSTSTNSSSPNTTDHHLIRGHLLPPLLSQLPFLPPLHQSSTSTDYNISGGNIGQHFGGIQVPSQLVSPTYNNSNYSNYNFQFQQQQLHFMSTNLEAPTPIGLFQFGVESENEARRSLVSNVSGINISLPQSEMVDIVKVEERQDPAGLNLSKLDVLPLGNSGSATTASDHFIWGGGNGNGSGSGNAWSDLPSNFSSSTSHLL